MGNLPLNPLLHERLKRIFGGVRISNAGESMQCEYVPEFAGSARLDMRIDSPGEYYQVCCPYCNDTRFRLWFNHRWGVKDEQGNRNLWLAVCYNENCLADAANRYDIMERINEDRCYNPISVREGRSASNRNKEVTLPGYVTRLDLLPPDHPANAYLSGRLYQPEGLGRFYRVGYCADSHFFLARNRIIVPVYANNDLVGWQGRYIGDMDWKAEGAPPKWFTMPGMAKGHILYNLDAAKEFHTGIVTEGCGDVWGVGPMGVATFGDTMTEHQKRMLVATFKKGACILLWDPEAMQPEAEIARLQAESQPKASKIQALKRRREKLDALYAELQGSFKDGFAPVILPEGRDPGSMDRGYMRRYVEQEAKAMGVKVSWKRR